MVEKAAMEGNVGESENWVHLFSRGEIFHLSSEAASLWKYLKVLELRKNNRDGSAPGLLTLRKGWVKSNALKVE